MNSTGDYDDAGDFRIFRNEGNAKVLKYMVDKSSQVRLILPSLSHNTISTLRAFYFAFFFI